MKFLNCKINLSKWNFLPRVETEFWVKKALKELKRTERTEARPLYALDVFAGTGCIGIAVLKNIRNSQADFVDIDKKAIEQIKINLKLNKISKNRYKIIQSDLFEKIKNKKYDFIFANPPYVAKERISEVQPSVLREEPKRALFGGKKGLFFIRKFLKEVKGRTRVIFLELDPQQIGDIKNILKKDGYKNYQFFKDQFGKYRWTRILL